MDAQHRHALKTNELAETLVKLRAWGEKWMNHILIGVAIILAAFAGYRFWSWRHESALVNGWAKLAKAETDDPTAGDASLDQLRQVIADAPDPALQTMARIKLAGALMDRASESDAATRLADAEHELTAAYDSASTPAILKAAVLYQLAVLYETKRDFAKAREAYEKLTTDAAFDASPFRKIAASRLTDLDAVATKLEFLPGSAPKPEPATQPATTGPSETPPAEAPASGPIELTPARAKPISPATTKPKAGVGEKPAEPKPEDEAPAQPKPEDDTPPEQPTKPSS